MLTGETKSIMVLRGNDENGWWFSIQVHDNNAHAGSSVVTCLAVVKRRGTVWFILLHILLEAPILRMEIQGLLARFT